MEWQIDPVHTSLELSVRHLGVFTVRGSFDQVTGTARTGDDGALQDVRVEIDASSINTSNAQRDGHLRSADFLDAETYPAITFQSTRIEPVRTGVYNVAGDLTIRGVTHLVSFEVETSDPITDPYGLTRAGASASGAISRKEWGLTWNQTLETGKLVVSDEVKFTADVQAVVPAPVPA